MPSQPVGRKLSLLSCCSIAGPSRIYEWERDREEVGLSLASSEKDDSWEEMLEIRLTCGATSRYNCSSRSADSSIAPPSSGARSSRISSSLLGAIGTDGKDQSLFFLAGPREIGADLTEFQGLGQNLSSSDRSAHDDFELHTDVRNSPITLFAGHQAEASVLLALRQRHGARNVPFAPPSFSASRTAEVSMRGARLVDASGIPPSR